MGKDRDARRAAEKEAKKAAKKKGKSAGALAMGLSSMSLIDKRQQKKRGPAARPLVIEGRPRTKDKLTACCAAVL